MCERIKILGVFLRKVGIGETLVNALDLADQRFVGGVIAQGRQVNILFARPLGETTTLEGFVEEVQTLAEPRSVTVTPVADDSMSKCERDTERVLSGTVSSDVSTPAAVAGAAEASGKRPMTSRPPRGTACPDGRCNIMAMS